ncbi:MAG: type VI secretion system tube protein Hcp [Bradyrhizobiaceae bacterium]|nr:type VI secretion system tube protein Hcp [Bradyrhizobiaceae bacterium]
MKRVFVAIAIMVMALVGTTATMQAAYEAYLQIEGVDGEVVVKGFDGAIQLLGYDWGIVSPRDPQSGQSTGKRMHKPITITKRVDATSALLASLCASGKPIARATLTVQRPSLQGAMENFLKIELTNILVTSIAHLDPDVDDDGLLDRMGINVVERLSFVYEKITWKDQVNGKEYTDDWSTP